MTWAIFRKELREQWLFAAVLVALGAAALAALGQLIGPPSYNRPDARPVAALLMAVAGGIVCGAMLLAGERETGTLPFLDTLPVSRSRLWAAKATFGVVLTLAQAGLLMGLTWGMGYLDNESGVGWAVAIVGGALLAYVWGLYGSASGRTVLGAVGRGLAAMFVAAAVAGFLSAAADEMMPHKQGNDVGAGMWIAVMVGVPLVGSVRTFARPDRMRRVSDTRRPERRERSGLGLWALVWLTLRQSRGLAAGLMGFAGLAGCLLLIEGARPLFVWPFLSLLLGVLCGATVFADEQAHGLGRFWGERRLPVGRLWAVKVLSHFGLAVVASFVTLLPNITAMQIELARDPTGSSPEHWMAELFRNPLPAMNAEGVPYYLFVWVTYGFAFGHLAGLLFRKVIVAALVALLSGGAAALVWVPSLVNGGLHVWQVFAPPLLLLVTARLLMWPWATERLGSARGVSLALGGTCAAVLALAGGIAYRVLEVPDVPDALAQSGFVESLPKPEENEAGRLIRQAGSEFERRQRELRQERPTRPLFPDSRSEQDPEQQLSFDTQLAEVLEHGWPEGETELGPWLDRLFASEWDETLAEAADKPLGMVEDPRRLTLGSLMDAVQQSREVALALTVRGLQCQAEGDPGAFVENLRSGLALARNLRSKAPYVSALVACACEGVLFRGLDHWLERLPDRPEVLRRALEVLREHEAEMPADPNEIRWAEALVLRNSIASPKLILGLLSHGRYPDESRNTAAGLMHFSWQVPWERERRQRLIRLAAADGSNLNLSVQELLAYGTPSWLNDLNLDRHAWAASELRATTLRRAALLKVALRLYHAETGKPAELLDQLVPKYLPEIPTDPYSGQPFRYRLSQGETIESDREVEPIPVEGGMGMMGPGGGGAAAPGEGEALPPGVVPGPGAGMGGMMAGPGMMGMVGSPGPPRELIKVPAGQGILWSVGPDRSDGGGRRMVIWRGAWGGGDYTGEDWIFLVPLPPQAD